ncbi:MAG: cation:proton antiporter [Candidatus Acidiferrales bacterium]
MNFGSHPIVIVMAIAVVSSLLGEIRVGVRIPVVVWEVVFGILVGPYVFGIVRGEGPLDSLGKLGLGALFFMAGMDLDLQKVKGRPLSLALFGWCGSLVLGLCAALILHVLPFVGTPIMVAFALTTTALGTLIPILRDAGELDSKFGSLLLAAGATGEFGPVVVISLFLTPLYGAWREAVFMLTFLAIAFVAAAIVLGVRPPKVLKLLERTMHSSTQLPVCGSVLLVACFAVFSEGIGLESVLGAFAAGMVVGLASRGSAGQVFREKMEAIAFGFMIPFFFVRSGVDVNLGALLHNPKTLLLVPVFLVLFLVVRGAPVFLYRNDLMKKDRWPFALYSATALPMVVAIAAIGVRTGRLNSETAAALVGAGLLSVLLFPTIARIQRANNTQTARSEAGSV